MKLVFLGPPGAGKGTQAEKICKKYDLAHISTGDLLRSEINRQSDIGKKVKAIIDGGELVPDSMIIEMIKNRITCQDCEQGYLLDGFPRTIVQADELRKLDEKINGVINLEVPMDKLAKRLSGRRVCADCKATYHISSLHSQQVCEKCGGVLAQRADDSLETVMNRLNVYQMQTAPLIDYYNQKGELFTINADQEIDKVFDDICVILEQL